MINRAIILGRIGFVETNNHDNKTYTKLSVATNEKWKDKLTGEKQEKTTWHNVYGFNKLGEIMAEYAEVGQLVYIEGKITHKKYIDESGIEKINFSITTTEFKILNSINQKSSQEGQKDVKVETSGNFLDDDIPW